MTSIGSMTNLGGGRGGGGSIQTPVGGNAGGSAAGEAQSLAGPGSARSSRDNACSYGSASLAHAVSTPDSLQGGGGSGGGGGGSGRRPPTPRTTRSSKSKQPQHSASLIA